MSGTQDEILAANSSTQEQQPSQADPETTQTTVQEAVTKTEDEPQKILSPSEKMDMLIRGTSSSQMKKEIEKLRKEAAKYRTASKNETAQNLALQAKAREIQKELDTLKQEHKKLTIMRKLDKAGCLKSDLVAKDLPQELEAQELDSFIEQYKEKNAFLFKTPKQNAGGIFKTARAKNLTPSQQMDAYIRAALGRN